MFQKNEKKIRINSTMNELKLSDDLTPQEQQNISQLHSLITQLAIKFDLGVSGEWNRANPDKVSIILSDNGFRKIAGQEVHEMENAAALQFLQSYQGDLTKEEHPHYSYMRSSVKTISISESKAILEALTLLNTPMQQYEPTIRMAC